MIREDVPLVTLPFKPWITYSGPWWGICRYQYTYSFPLIVEWSQGRCTASPAVLSIAPGCMDLASPIMPEGLRNNGLALECQIWVHLRSDSGALLNSLWPQPLHEHFCVCHTGQDKCYWYLLLSYLEPLAKDQLLYSRPWGLMNSKLLTVSELWDSGDLLWVVDMRKLLTAMPRFSRAGVGDVWPVGHIRSRNRLVWPCQGISGE